MEHNMEETTVQRIEYPISIDEKNRRAGSPRRSVSNCPMSSAECQAEEYNHATGISVYEYELKSHVTNEDFL